MTSVSRRTTAIAVALAAGSTLTMAGAATAQPARHHHGHGAVVSAPLAKGLYQTAYSERNHVLWATASVGRPPVTDSRLLKLSPRTLAVKASYTPPVTNGETGAVEAVYGIDVDDEHNTVWTTNTRDDSVAVYSQATGRHLATLPNVDHAREVVVDERHNLAWASANGGSAVIAFDTKTFKEKKRITIEGSSPAGLDVNERTGEVYATDLANDRIIEIRLHGSTHFVPTGAGPISVALSRNGRTLYTANQADGTVSVLNERTGRLVRTVPTGEGALSVAADDRTGKVVVANRTAATVSILDPRRGQTTTVTTAANPNHVVAADGTAYVVDKSGSGPAGEDLGYRINLCGHWHAHQHGH